MSQMILSLDQLKDSKFSVSQNQKELKQFGLKTRELLRKNQRFSFKLSNELKQEFYAPFEPDLFGAQDTEANRESKKYSLAIRMPPDAIEAVLAFEEHVKGLLQDIGLDSASLWHSAIRDDLLRLKVKLAGPGKVACFDKDKDPLPDPVSWRRRELNAVVAVRGLYFRRDSAGLQLDLTHAMFGDEVERPDQAIANPF